MAPPRQGDGLDHAEVKVENMVSISLRRPIAIFWGQSVLAIPLLVAVASLSCGHDNPIESFSTGGHTVYHLRTGKIESAGSAIISAAYDGTVLCHRPDGVLHWKAETGGNFPFDMAVADIDEDQLDETLVASADGNLYAFDQDGSRLWVFERTPPLFQVCTARLSNGSTVILTGGVEQTLYTLSPQGSILGMLQTEACIRHLRAGNILASDRDHVALATASRGLSGDLSLHLIDPADTSVQWRRENLGTHAHNSGKRFFSMAILDLNKDGRDEILLSNSWGEHGRIFAYDSQGEEVFTTQDQKIPNVPYRMNLLRHVYLPKDEFVLGHFGNILIVYNLDGSCREVLTGPYSFADGTFDPETNTYFMGSSVSGGDGIYTLHLDRPDWREDYAGMKAAGRLARMETNYEQLKEQIALFAPPSYQPEPRDAVVLGRKPEGREYQHLRFLSGRTWSQKLENRDQLWCRDIDRRRKYDMSADEIVDAARSMEREGLDFVVWAGHGHAVHFPLSTFRRIFEAAPEHLFGFEFAEMEGVDQEMQEVVDQILLPVAEMCRMNGKHIILRSKNIYWNGTCYLPFLKRVLLNSQYSGVFIPALEETNCRTQELSLAGRIGLWVTGSFDRWACRMVTDNANFDRMWEWAGQQLPNHHLRHLVSRASLGSDLFFNSIHQGPFTESVYEKIIPFYEMVEKGIVYIPKRNELLSLSEIAFGMRSPPSSSFIRHGVNGHHYRYPVDRHPPMVFDRLDCYWAGAPTAPHDPSFYAMQLRRRMCNYLPFNSFGLVPIIPSDAGNVERFKQVFETDGQYFYDQRGERFSAAQHKPTVERTLRAASTRLPVRVRGAVHWSVARLDPTHVRITLIDPGYLDPADRQATIILQHLDGIACKDILSREDLLIENGQIELTVPAGIFRVLDIEHR